MEEDSKIVVCSGAQNIALNLPIVLENMFSCLDWQTLCECRQVNKNWHKYSLNPWRGLAPSITLGEHEICQATSAVLNQISLHSDQKGENYKWGGVVNYTNIKIYAMKLTNEWIDKHPILRARNNCIKKLSIKACSFSNPEQLQDILFCKYTPKLTSLKLSNLKFDFDINHVAKEEASISDVTSTIATFANNSITTLTSLDVDYTCFAFIKLPFSWVTLLLNYPNLKELRAKNYSRDELETIFTALNKIHSKGNKSSTLTTIDICERDYWSGPVFEYTLPLYNSLLSTDGCLPNLHSLSLAIGIGDSWNKLANLLKFVSDKLIYLKIKGSFTGKNRSLRIPVVMAKLESITLQRFHLKNLNFLNKTPQLKKLYVIEERKFRDSHNIIKSTTTLTWDEDTDDGISDCKAICEYLSTFACNQVVPYSDEDICRLQKWMPNLSTIKLHLNNSSFFSICEKFPRTRKLYICQSKVTDYGYTGERFCRRHKKMDDDEDYIRTEYYDAGFAVENSEIPYKDEVDDSDDGDSVDSPRVKHNNDVDEFKNEMEEMSNDQPDINQAETKEDEKVELQGAVAEIGQKNDGGEIEEGQPEMFSDSEGSDSGMTYNIAIRDPTWKQRIKDSLLAVEERYQREVYPHASEMTNSLSFVCPYNTICLQDLEVLVIERCKNEYGVSGLMSTVPFRITFPYLPRLREVWVEEGVMTVSGLRYAEYFGLYREFDRENKASPRLTD